MNDPAKRFLRVVLGLVMGLFGGIVVGICLLMLTCSICMMDGGNIGKRPEHAWLGSLIFIAVRAIYPTTISIGCILGVIWAVRRNRRDDAKPAPP